VLSLGLGAAPALGGAGADKIALHVGEASEYGRASKRPVLLALSAQGSASDRNCALASTMRLTIPNRSKVLRARRSIRVTVTTSPGSACRASC
jgi:hypothetical protein